MRFGNVSKRLLADLTKLALLVSMFFVLQHQVTGVRAVAESESRVVANHAADQRRLAERNEELQTQLEHAVLTLTELKKEVRSLSTTLSRARTETVRVDEKMASLETLVSRRIDGESRRVDALEKQTVKADSQIAELSNNRVRDAKRMKRLMLDPTAQLRGNGTVGSGVLFYSEAQREESVDAGYTTFVLTAYHVVLEVSGDDHPLFVEEVRVTIPGADEMTPFSARVVLFDRQRDLALLRLDADVRFDNLVDLMPLEALDRLDVFSPAYAVGCPLGNQPFPTLGEVSSRNKPVGAQNFWMLNAPTFFGNSGGGVYLAESCRLIGISSMIYTYGKSNPTVVPHMGLFVPLREVYRWLDEEDFAFVYRRRPVPDRLVWKLLPSVEEGEASSPFASTSATADDD